jgi:hypothetical protein
MARKSIKTNYYLFDASAREIIIPGGIQREQLILITNVTDNKVIYNFSDPELTATEYHISTDIRNVVTTRVVLAYDTTAMSDTDKLQIIYDDFEETIKPAETYMDAVNKSRVSTPQSQIDTDFEYGTQETKWEGLSAINNNPFAYKGADAFAFTNIQVLTTNSKTITVSANVGTSGTPLISAGQAIYVQDTNFPGANGVFIIDRVNYASNLFTYTAKYEYNAGTGSILLAGRTAIYKGVHYTGSEIGGNMNQTSPQSFEAIASGVMAGSVKVTCENAHGLDVGNEIAVFSPDSTNCQGSWTVARVEDPFTFYYFPDGTPSSANAGTDKKLYPRPQGSSVHRAYDGGVKLSTNSFSKNQQAIRQTKRYFRYQSGKGVAFSTGSILAPAIENVDSISSPSGTTARVVCAVAHNVTRDTIVKVNGVNDNVYNGEFQVTNVINPYTFEYNLGVSPSDTSPGGEFTVTPINAYGARFEIGMMDQQNGIFFRYANGHLEVVRRTSTYQLAGKITVTQGSTTINGYVSDNGATCKFSKQLEIGDYIVIRGVSYRVDGIHDDDELTIFPDYRGPSAVNLSVTKTVETSWAQSEWNLDRCDGSGKSGYTIDVTKMQMFYMDYSWYGAGFIRWGFRAEDGNVIYAHKIPNNNANTEAYMRSGNLPARYEVNTICPKTTLAKTLSSGDTTMYITKAPLDFPPSGTLRVRKTPPAGGASTVEYINYSGKTEFKQDVIGVSGALDTIAVSDITGLSGGGNQPIVFDRPFSNVVANKIYYVHSVQLTEKTFKITTVSGGAGAVYQLDTAVGSQLSPLAVAQSGAFTGLTREQAGATGVNTVTGFTYNGTTKIGESSGTISSGTGIQKGQLVVGSGVPADTFVHSISGTSLSLSKAVYTNQPTGLKFIPMGSGAAQTFTYETQTPTGVELIRATSVPTISHWGSSVIMEGRLDDDRAYVYTVGTKSQRNIAGDATRAVLALRVAPSVDNGISGNFGTRELINRMQLVLRQVDTSSNGKFFVELLLNPVPDTSNTWLPVGGTSLAEYSVLDVDTVLSGGEVIYGFYSDNGVNAYDLSDVKEISNSILGGGGTSYSSSTSPNPTGIFPDGPEVLAVRVTNLTGSTKNIDARFSWTEAQA